MTRLGRSGGWLSRRRPETILALAVLLMACLSGIDYVTGSEVGFSIFYLVPVALVTWFVSRAMGVVFAVASALLWGIIDIAAGASYSSDLIPMWNALIRLGFFVITLWLLSEVHAAHQRERTLARLDSLTELLNGREFDVVLDRELELARRSGRPFTLSYIDLDHFKIVNDTLGHARGDDVLHAVAAAIRSTVRSTDVAARLGGDEFGILLPETDGEHARATLDRVRARISAELTDLGALPPGVGATLGAVVFHEAPPSSEEAVRLADGLMYEGKREGRGRIVLRDWPDGAAVGFDAPAGDYGARD